MMVLTSALPPPFALGPALSSWSPAKGSVTTRAQNRHVFINGEMTTPLSSHACSPQTNPARLLFPLFNPYRRSPIICKSPRGLFRFAFVFMFPFSFLARAFLSFLPPEVVQFCTSNVLVHSVLTSKPKIIPTLRSTLSQNAIPSPRRCYHTHQRFLKVVECLGQSSPSCDLFSSESLPLSNFPFFP